MTRRLLALARRSRKAAAAQHQHETDHWFDVLRTTPNDPHTAAALAGRFKQVTP